MRLTQPVSELSSRVDRWEQRQDTELASEPHAAASELMATTSKMEHIFITLGR